MVEYVKTIRENIKKYVSTDNNNSKKSWQEEEKYFSSWWFVYDVFMERIKTKEVCLINLLETMSISTTLIQGSKFLHSMDSKWRIFT